ncbi:MAG: orotate phosphoribosyltransferase [Candidatus Staskawiczbacteria bacterium RIFCSPHIGHO2_02_FULL_34_10]|uniref:Orotate phosphoribosyltransferase n=2 Tax=Candidatus Staskawicziibacteriota TaxID=1817916 RepID=A0A1G2HIW7_9BACT|nr:MAG: orotate phosphoribosyltransferase [Candidatus Staskawiczbacteria bacterium RIFCSPHIGHO2_01_FULL_34_27]OGZ67102.1 MAG: orotate phosphoribosyltransferase [Candidatus Staskawiczbacteria bacterium RIFCSPHIGHO2_02_FULL_34_10]
MNYAASFISYALSIGAIELIPKGRMLKSGRISPYFFNSGLFNKGESMYKLAIAYTDVIYKHFLPDVVFGPSYKGSAIAVAVAMTMGGEVGYAYNRKEAKDHGEGGIIIGDSLYYEKKVCLVDDVMTTGDSLIEALGIVRKGGGIPIGCVIAFDRQERGKDSNLSAVQEFEAKYKIPVFAAATLDDLIEVLEKDEKMSSILIKILDYKQQYGV